MVHKFLAKFSILLHVCATCFDSIPPFCLFCKANFLSLRQICIIENPRGFLHGGFVMGYALWIFTGLQELHRSNASLQ